MVQSIVRDAVQIKMKLKAESPLISVDEFCYAAGLGLKISGMEEKAAEGIRDMVDFLKLKDKVKELLREDKNLDEYPQGERLKSLILGCRIRGEMSEDARALFDMGYQNK